MLVKVRCGDMRTVISRSHTAESGFGMHSCLAFPHLAPYVLALSTYDKHGPA